MSAFYDQASLVVVPSGYKSGKIYAQKPLTTDGQLTFTRASTATRVNASGLIESVASGVPRLDYLGSTCPKLLLEPQRTNVYPTGSALVTTGWASAGATLTAGQTDPNGGTTALRVQFTAGTSYIYQAFGGSAVSYVRSAYIKGASAQTIKLAEAFTGVTKTITLTTSYQRFDFVSSGVSGGVSIQFDNTSDNAAKDFTIAFLQIEEGAYATSYIPTTSAAITRLGDGISSKDVTTVGISTNFSMFFDIPDVEIGVVDFTLWLTNAWSIYSSTVIIPTTTGAEYPTSITKPSKFCFTYDGTNAIVYKNGVKYGPYLANASWANATNLNFSSVNKLGIKQILISPSVFTDAQALELTTL